MQNAKIKMQNYGKDLIKNQNAKFKIEVRIYKNASGRRG